MDHVVIPIDAGHVRPLAGLVDGAAAAAGFDRYPSRSSPHITLIAYSGLPPAPTASAVGTVVAMTAPFTVHAHGYGFFTGSNPTDLSLHVPVVRSGPLDALHANLCTALRDAGAVIAGWSEPVWWSPHITLLDRQLDATRLGNAAAWLARRHHPSWRIPVDRVALTGGWTARHRTGTVFPLDVREPTVKRREGVRA